ncbi:MAG: hypothetical protein DI498_00220 [Paracoccus denitrificans]|nr:MAG: hypothetical protein DI498_00220 [Paracoccus denitrificans]PZO86198.1 MAG: hypothetical protein DI633_00220 [Paracoccus denitrificans]
MGVFFDFTLTSNPVLRNSRTRPLPQAWHPEPVRRAHREELPQSEYLLRDIGVEVPSDLPKRPRMPSIVLNGYMW